MSSDQFRSALRRKPFSSFLVRTTDGESYAVSHPEAAWQSPDGSTVIIYTHGQNGMAVAMIDCSHIASIVFEYQGAETG